MGDEKRTVDVNKPVTNCEGAQIIAPGADGRPLAVTVGHGLANVIGAMRPRQGEEILRIQEFGLRIVRAMKGEAPLEMDAADRAILKEAIRQDIQRGQIAEREGRKGGNSALMLAPLMKLLDEPKDSKES